ncbi:MAG TPA: hypothetical protein VGN17_30690 [Bryobacteraceae bacterium]|jgi:hypothetical protein
MSRFTEAKAALAEIERKKSQLSLAQAQAIEQLDHAKTSGARALLAGRDPGASAIAGLSATIDMTAHALDLLEVEERPAAERELKLASAQDFRNQAEALYKQLAEIEKKVRPHLDALSKIEGIEYTTAVLSAQRTAAWNNGSPDSSLFKKGGKLEHLGPSDLRADPINPNHWEIPLSRKIRKQADDLRMKAEAIESELNPAEEPPAYVPPVPARREGPPDHRPFLP